MPPSAGPALSAWICPRCGASLPPNAEGYVVCQYCGTSLISNQPAGSNPAQAGSAPATAQHGIKLKMVTHVDTQGTGLPVFRMLLPAGWQQQGGCRWLLDNPGMPATVAYQAWNPAGAEAFEILPNINLIWNTNPWGRPPTGSRHFGAEVREPMDVRSALRTMVLPRFRGQFSRLQILKEEPFPELPQLAKSEAPLTGGSAEGGKLRIQYELQGHAFEEEIYGVVEVFRAPMTTLFGASEILVWFVDYLFSFRAGVGKLDATAELFKVMISSFQLNPQWYAALKSVAQFLAQRQIQQIHHIGQIGQIYAQTGAEMRQQNLNDWYSRQATYDRLSTDWSRAMRGVDGFFDPHREEVVELPSGYGHAWANNLGEYILTEDPNFNPNLSSTQQWEEMEQRA